MPAYPVGSFGVKGAKWLIILEWLFKTNWLSPLSHILL